MLGKYRCDFSVVGAWIMEKKISSIECRKKSGIAWVLLYSICDWPRNLAPISPPIRLKRKINHDSITRYFPHFRWLSFFYYEFSLALRNTFPSSGWPLGFPWVWFYVTLSKCTLAWITDCYWRMNHWVISFVVDNDCP